MKTKLMTLLLTSLAPLAVLVPVVAQADCSTEYEICEKTCYVKYFNDDAAITGCKSKCVAQKGVCLAKVGADKTVEAGEDAWEGTKSFFKGMTDD